MQGSDIYAAGDVNINVAGNTHIAGATVAATDTEGNDNGQLSLTTETLIVEHLDNSSTASNQRIGANSSISESSGVGTTGIQFGTGTSIEQSVTLATLGEGSVTVNSDAENDTDTTDELNRDTGNTALELFSTETGTEVDATVDTRLITADGIAQIKNDFVDSYEFGEDIYRSAEKLSESEQLDLLNFWSALHNNAQATQLKNDLIRNPENALILEGLKSGDGDQYAQAMADLAQLAQEKFGLKVSDLYFYNSDETTSTSLADSSATDVLGSTVTDENSEYAGDIFIDAEGSKYTQVETLGHEVLETETYQQSETNGETQEALSEAFGEQFADRIDQATDGELQTSSTEAFSASLENSSAVETGTEIANEVGSAEVDHNAIQLARYVLPGVFITGATTIAVQQNSEELASAVEGLLNQSNSIENLFEENLLDHLSYEDLGSFMQEGEILAVGDGPLDPDSGYLIRSEDGVTFTQDLSIAQGFQSAFMDASITNEIMIDRMAISQLDTGDIAEGLNVGQAYALSDGYVIYKYSETSYFTTTTADALANEEMSLIDDVQLMTQLPEDVIEPLPGFTPELVELEPEFLPIAEEVDAATPPTEDQSGILIELGTIGGSEIPEQSIEDLILTSENAEGQGEYSQFNFTNTTTERMNDENRAIPIQTLGDIISEPIYRDDDPQGSDADMYYSQIWKNGKQYNIEVLYDVETNTILHFKYTQKGLGSLGPISK